MRFMAMIKADKNSEAGIPPSPELLAVLGKLTHEAMQSGVVVETGGLGPSSQGAKVKVAAGEISVIDGPFAETKEIVGGYAVLEAASLAEAIQHARQFMQAHIDALGSDYEGECEVRPMFCMPKP